MFAFVFFSTIYELFVVTSISSVPISKYNNFKSENVAFCQFLWALRQPAGLADDEQPRNVYKAKLLYMTLPSMPT